MPASRRRCSSDAPGPRGRGLAGDGEAVSEVLGYVLSFAIVSAVVVLALLAFNTAQAQTEDRVVEMRAQSIAQRVAGQVVAASLLAEQASVESWSRPMDLPLDLEGRSYAVAIADDGGGRYVVRVTVDGGIEVEEPVFGAEASVALCERAVPGNDLRVAYGDPPATSPDTCTASASYVFLEPQT